MSSPTPEFLSRLVSIVGAEGHSTDPEVLAPHLVEWRGRWRGNTPILLLPKTTDEVSRIVAACHDAGVGIVPQGGNTGLQGGQIPGAHGNEVLLTLSRMNRVRSVDPIDNSMVVEAGMTLLAVQQAAAEHDRLFPLSLGAEGTCQIGGNLATNAGGIHVVRYGNARSLVLGLEVVLPDGRVWDGLRALRKDNTGIDLKNLFVGSEGTLGIITAAVLKLFPRHRQVSTVFAAVPSIEAAVALLGHTQHRVEDAVLAFELLPHSALELVTRHIPGTVNPLGEVSPFYVLFDLTAPRALAESVIESALENGIVTDATIADSPSKGQALWRIRESLPDAQKNEGASIKHDVSVAVSRIPAYVAEAEKQIRALIPDCRPVTFGHLGDGNLHLCVSRPVAMRDADFLAMRDPVNHIVHDLAHEAGGSISAEHGIGIGKREEIRRYKSAVELELNTRIKQALDPRGIMNPGKGVG